MDLTKNSMREESPIAAITQTAGAKTNNRRTITPEILTFNE